MNRRRFLHTTALTAACSVISGCYRARSRASVPLPGNDCDLAPVLVSPDREIRTVVGLRPHRPSGFVVRAEKLGEKLIIHNYGHGGGGITLSWGTSQLATELLPGEPSSPVAVIGCGAVGLATARLLQDRGLHVTIYASELPPNTTSNVAGGQWLPFDVFEFGKQSTAFMNQFLRATEFAYRRYQTLLGARYGIHWIRNYSLRHGEFDEADLEGMQSPIRKFMPEMRDLSEAEHPFSGYQHVRKYDTMLIEPPIYLNAMLTDFRIAGGTVRTVKFEHVTQLQQLAERVIFNGILLGGLFQEGEWSLSVDEATRARVLRGHAQFFGSFRRCSRTSLKDFQPDHAIGTNRSNLAV